MSFKNPTPAEIATTFDALRAYEDMVSADFDEAPEKVAHFLELEAERLAQVCLRLEDKFKLMGLEFTENFRGAMPVQAYGWILGQRFYFRFRRDRAVLTLGTVDPVKAQEEYERKVTQFARNRYEFTNTTDVPFEGLPEEKQLELRTAVIEDRNLKVETDLDIDAYPTAVTQQVSLDDFTGNDFAGTLSPVEAEEIFSFLVEKLTY